MANKTFNKLRKMNTVDRRSAVGMNSALLSQLTPTEIALLFPDYFKRGKPDVGGFREAISQETARKQADWQKGVEERAGKQGQRMSWLENMRGKYSESGTYGGSASGRAVATDLGKRLMKDYGLTNYQAAGILAHLGHESAGFNVGINEQNPIVANSRGGFGLAQWTGDRRRRLEAFASKNGMPLNSLDTQYAYMKQEPEFQKYIGAVKSSSSMEEAAQAFAPYESGGDPRWAAAWGSRLKWGRTAMSWMAGEPADDKNKQTQTPGQKNSATTPASGGGGNTTGGMSFEVKSNYIVPKDSNLYDPRNAQQCATLGKAFNPSIGRSSGWTIVDGDIKAGQVVATKQYNNGGADRTGAGYHTGVALTAPNEKGDFLLLEQYNNSGGAKTRWVNKNSYPIGNTGQATSWGLISSGGKVHDEVSQEALSYGQGLATPEQRQSIGSNTGGPGTGGESAPGVSGEVSTGGPIGGGPIGQDQTASLLQPGGMTPNLMNSPMSMMMGMMGGFGGMQSATPLGLITTAMGFIMPLIGSFMGERVSGEGMGDGRALPRIHVRGSRRNLHAAPRNSSSTTKSAEPLDITPIIHRSSLGELSRQYESGKRGVHTVSSGKGDPGGVSYGEHQLSSKKGTMGEYLKSGEGKSYAHHFAGMQPGTQQFNKTYKQIAQNDPTGFAKSQHSFITRTHYEPVYRHAKRLGYNVDDPRVQEALFSMSVQHGKANRIVNMAKGSASGSAEDQVHALYAARHQYTMKNRQNFSKRYGAEKQDILAMNVGKYNLDYPTAQVASAQASTPVVGAGVTTPPAAATGVTSQATREVGLGERLAKLAPIGSSGAAAATPLATTPGVGASPATASTTAPMPSLNAFAAGKNMSATVMPSLGADTATLPRMMGTPGAMPAPGPAPDMASAQVGAMRNQMAVMAQQQGTPAMAPQTTTPTTQTQGFNPDHAMKQIAQPMNTPSFQRAMFNINGETTPGEVGQNHFNYGNAR